MEIAEPVRALLAGTEWANDDVAPIRNDASRRQYWRLGSKERSIILMDASDDEPIEPFLEIAELFRERGLRTPRIHKAVSSARIALVEDFGDELVASVLATCFDHQIIYECAVDNLLELQRKPPPLWLPPYDREFYKKELAIFLTNSNLPLSTSAECQFWEIWESLLPVLQESDEVIVHRDFHVQNLIWFPDARGIARLGILDFQGARRGSRLYDLVSLLEDARRPVAESIRTAMIDRFHAHNDQYDRAKAERVYNILSVQRNLKILGIFNRLINSERRTEYRDYVPNVLQALRRALSHPSLWPMRHWYLEHHGTL